MPARFKREIPNMNPSTKRPRGPVMIDVAGTALTDEERERASHDHPPAHADHSHRLGRRRDLDPTQ